ncbi:sigma-54-dependent Fis family transcriptional regulator [Endozoicomonas sp. SM1973]|uniref:DNA-binding transcriptional regulator NtrC n=1 Tax=Spartinivicinus marinus TaxID=2994442 RepID=A0A853HYW3_9GAMM|nr:sigma-54 dependent transcriptional regulator [Spartinivicinus marinus]MCX4027445.1 sigma-54 dependent transcriptional regulator [Spartinivicinus marinus]NYZ66383.1 sigma-54-dependent Fis family transcriptional regulator [Spartinivicinus marinus]
MTHLLIVDDDQPIRRTLELHLSQHYQTTLASNVEEALATPNIPDIILLDICMPGISGLEAIPDFKLKWVNCRIIIMTAFHDMKSTIVAMQRGADEYIYKPIDIFELDKAIQQAINYQNSCIDKNLVIPTAIQQTIVGSSSSMREIFKTIGKIANTCTTVMITGESGTGKEMVAKAIHHASDRHNKPFIAINCAALVDSLLEAELFGYKKGAFTGAVTDQTGKFQLAHNGTLFLDEIGELSPIIQAKLLRVLQEQQVSPLGSQDPISINTRIISATNVDLEYAIEKNQFRKDLYYRLQVVNINLPPLRQRKSDLPELVSFLLSKASKMLGRQVNKVAVGVMDKLYQHDWPGNIRELENTLTKAAALCCGEIITLADLPDNIYQQPAKPNMTTNKVASTEQNKQAIYSLKEMEKKHVAKVLNYTNWHKGHACEILGISRPRLQRLIAQFNLVKSEL